MYHHILTCPQCILDLYSQINLSSVSYTGEDMLGMTNRYVSWALRNWRPVQSFHGWRWKPTVLGRSDRVQEMEQNYLNIFNQVSRSCLCERTNLLICTLNKFYRQITYTVLPAGILLFVLVCTSTSTMHIPLCASIFYSIGKETDLSFKDMTKLSHPLEISPFLLPSIEGK